MARKMHRFSLKFPDAGESIFYGWGRLRRGRAWSGTHADRHERRTTDLFGDVVPPLDVFPHPWRRIKTDAGLVQEHWLCQGSFRTLFRSLATT